MSETASFIRVVSGTPLASSRALFSVLDINSRSVHDVGDVTDLSHSLLFGLQFPPHGGIIPEGAALKMNGNSGS